MEYTILPTNHEPYQVIYLPVSPDGNAFLAKIELRYLPATELWYLSIGEAISGDVYVNQIPVVCSRREINDLLYPFRWMNQGTGIGSLFCVKAVENPATQDPGRENLGEFYIIWGDRWE